jgi:hypothetical protein
MPSKLSHRLLILLGLGIALALTRTTHFGTSEILPDASLAVFLLGGFLLGRVCGFTVLMAAAFGADVVSAQTAEQAGWCLTPAYWGLVPTYATLWLAGRWLGKRHQAGKLDIVQAAGVSVGAIAVAFVISNLTWFAFSNTVNAMGLADFALAVAKYFPPYLGSAMLYLVPAWLGWKLAQNRAHKPQSL